MAAEPSTSIPATSQGVSLVLAAGAFSDPEKAFDRLTPYLNNMHLFSSINIAHIPSSNPSDPANATSAKDAEAIRNHTFLPLIEEQGKDVIFFAHSYGGLCGGAAARGLSKQDRVQRGQAGGLIGLIYLVGNIVPANNSLIDTVGGQFPPYIKQDTPAQNLSIMSPAIDTMYGDTPSSLHPELEASITPHATNAFKTAAGAPAWAEECYNGRRIYIRTLQDNTFPSALQDTFVAQSGVSWDVKDLNASHGALMSRPAEVARIIKEAAESWVGARAS